MNKNSNGKHRNYYIACYGTLHVKYRSEGKGKHSGWKSGVCCHNLTTVVQRDPVICDNTGEVQIRSAMHRNATQRNAMQRSATQCNAVQRSATRCNAMQRDATRRNAMQRDATRCNGVHRSAMQRKYRSAVTTCLPVVSC